MPMASPTGASNGGYMVLVPPQQGATATVSALVNKDSAGNVTVPTEMWIQNASGLYVPVSATNPMPTVLTGSSATIGTVVLGAGTAQAGVITPSFSNGTQWQPASAPANSGASGATIGSIAPWLYNGATFDSEQNNQHLLLLSLATRTASVTTPTQTNTDKQTLTLVLYVSAASGTGGLTVRVLVSPSGLNYNLLVASAAVTTIGTFVYVITPTTAPTTALVTQSALGSLPRNWFVSITPADSSDYTYSVDAFLN